MKRGRDVGFRNRGAHPSQRARLRRFVHRAERNVVRGNQGRDEDIKKNAVVSALIKDGEVQSADVADNGLTGADIDESSLSLPPAAGIGAGAIGTAQLADGAVTIPKLSGSRTHRSPERQCRPSTR